METRVKEASKLLEEIAGIDHIFITEKERTQYEHRVESFAKQWFKINKLWMISPREIARFGWKLNDTLALECSACKIHIEVLEDKLEVAESDKELVAQCDSVLSCSKSITSSKTQQTITLRDSHKPFCRWMVSDIPPRFSLVYAIPEIITKFSDMYGRSSPAALYCFSQNLESMALCPEEYLPPVCPSSVTSIEKEIGYLFNEKDQSFSELLLKRIQESDFEKPVSGTEWTWQICILALTGWEAIELSNSSTTTPRKYGTQLQKRSSSHSPYILRCQWCHRDIGAWNFKESSTSTPSPKRSRLSDVGVPLKSNFDGFKQHRSFCPWVNQLEDEMPAWKQVAQYFFKTNIHALDLEGGFKTINYALSHAVH